MYKITAFGVTVTCETAEEAVQLVEAIGVIEAEETPKPVGLQSHHDT